MDVLIGEEDGWMFQGWEQEGHEGMLLREMVQGWTGH